MQRTKYTERNMFGLPNIVIPAELLFNEELTNTEKILFGFLSNLSNNEQGYCWASNRYISRLINVKPETVSNMISKLCRLGYLCVQHETRYDGVQVRKIWIDVTYPQKYQNMLQEALRKILRPLKQILKGDKANPKGALSKSLSNIDNNIDKDIVDTKVSYVPSEHSQEILRYWNNLPNSIQHKPSSKVYLTSCQMIDNLLQGFPIICTKNNRPYKNLISFCQKHGIDQEILSRTWDIDEIKKLLSSINRSQNEKISLESILWNNFARGGAFSYFLFEADKKEISEEYIEMADKLSQAIGSSLSSSKRLHWAKSFQSLHSENGKTEKQIHEVLDWYLKNYDFPKVRSVMNAEEFCNYYHKIYKSMQIHKEERKPQHSKLRNAYHEPDKQYPC